MPMQMSFGAIIRNDFTATPCVNLKLRYGKNNWKIFNRNELNFPTTLLQLNFPTTLLHVTLIRAVTQSVTLLPASGI